MYSQINDYSDLTDEELRFLLDNLDHFSPEEAQEIDLITDELEKRRKSVACRDDLIEFCKKMQSDYKVVSIIGLSLIHI